MRIEEMAGMQVNGRKILTVLIQALNCSRNTNQPKMKEGLLLYESQRKEMLRQNGSQGTLDYCLDALTEAVFRCFFVYSVHILVLASMRFH